MYTTLSKMDSKINNFNIRTLHFENPLRCQIFCQSHSNQMPDPTPLLILVPLPRQKKYLWYFIIIINHIYCWIVAVFSLKICETQRTPTRQNLSGIILINLRLSSTSSISYEYLYYLVSAMI